MGAVEMRRVVMGAQNKEYDCVIVGLGKTGMSCVRHLRGKGLRIAVVDSRPSPPGLSVMRSEFPEIPVFVGAFNAEVIGRAQRLLLSPGVSPGEPTILAAARAGVELIGDIEMFSLSARRPIVAVTGSNGKSTVATLVHEMILGAGRNSALGGNIGTPALDLLAREEPDYYVLELSSFQLETMHSLAAVAATVLNVTADHMDRYDSLRDYASAKERIYARAENLIVNLDDPIVAAMTRPGRPSLGFTAAVPDGDNFGIRRIRGAPWLARGERAIMPVADVAIQGQHNAANALAALALGTVIGLPEAAMCATLRSFTGLPHRCQWIAQCEGVDWYNDSKGTNVGAACAAIRGLGAGRGLILIAGGDGKGADFAALAEAAAGRVRHAVLIGRDAPVLAKALEPVLPVCYATDMDAAVAAAARLGRPGDIVLLSPACASFDMYENYEQRGEFFIRAVRSLCSTAGSP